VKAGGPADQLDRERGRRRAHAATLLLLGLPGSTYLYQGEELGLHEVAEISPEQRQDPAFFRGGEFDGLGRDGCRVPLPWTADGSSFGFGADGAHLPQPAWFAEYAVDVEAADPSSTLSLYREALRLRHRLQTAESLEWIETGRVDVLRFARPNGWQVVTNFGAEPFDLGADASAVVLGPVDGGALPGESTVWIAPQELIG
jgi:alpha-glucosidase